MIEIRNLTKYFKKKKVLDNLSIEIPIGITGVLGPNGAGKTTLFRCLIGTEKYSGNIDFQGEKKVGYLPQDFDCYHELTVKEAMDYISALKGDDGAENDRLIEETGLLSEKDKKVKKLSGGMKRRLGIAQAIIGHPKIVLMDEPTAGLDPESRFHIRNLISSIGTDASVVVSSHIASDLDAIADQMLFLDKGRIKYFGSRDKVLSSLEGKVFEVRMNREDYKKTDIPFLSVRWDGEYVTLRVVSADIVPNNGNPAAPNIEDAYYYYVGQRSV